MNPLLAALVAAGVIDRDEAERINRMLDAELGRVWAEQQLAAATARALAAQQQRLAAAAQEGGADRLLQASLWSAEDTALARDILPTVRGLAGEQAIIASVRSGLDMWQATNHAVIEWVESYYISAEAGALGSIPNLNATARTAIGNMVNAWQRGELEAGTVEGGLPQLVAAMEETFGAERGARISVTETTRIFAESTRAAALANPYVTRLTWATARDDVTCAICGPMDGRSILKGAGSFPGGLFPPAHPNCRCWVREESELTAAVPLGMGGAGTWTYA